MHFFVLIEQKYHFPVHASILHRSWIRGLDKRLLHSDIKCHVISFFINHELKCGMLVFTFID